jgi:hypothetical protein
MIKITKEKNEMRGNSPHKILTVEFDLESVQQDSKDMTLEQLKVLIGTHFTNKLASMIKCKP